MHIQLPFTAKKKPLRKRKTAYDNDRLAQAVAIIATVMAASYIVIRIFNWIRFL